MVYVLLRAYTVVDVVMCSQCVSQYVIDMLMGKVV